MRSDYQSVVCHTEEAVKQSMEENGVQWDSLWRQNLGSDSWKDDLNLALSVTHFDSRSADAFVFVAAML